MNDTRGHPPVPIELVKLRSATTTYLAIIHDIESWTQQAADVNRRIRPDYAGQLDGLRDELMTAQLPHDMGTPAAIARVVGELLGKA